MIEEKKEISKEQNSVLEDEKIVGKKEIDSHIENPMEEEKKKTEDTNKEVEGKKITENPPTDSMKPEAKKEDETKKKEQHKKKKKGELSPQAKQKIKKVLQGELNKRLRVLNFAFVCALGLYLANIVLTYYVK